MNDAGVLDNNVHEFVASNIGSDDNDNDNNNSNTNNNSNSDNDNTDDNDDYDDDDDTYEYDIANNSDDYECNEECNNHGGLYVIDISENSWEDRWSYLHEDLISYYERHGETICRNAKSVRMTITGYMRARIIDTEGNQTIFYAHPSYHGSPWYDWAYVHFVEKDEEVYYPSKILGFVEGGTTE